MPKQSDEITVFDIDKPTVDQLLIEELVSALEKCGGDIDIFTRGFKNMPGYILYCVEKKLSEQEDNSLRERWNKAIEYFNKSKMLLIQRSAMGMLEHYDASSDNKGNTELAYCKLVLSDLFAANNTLARMRAGMVEDRSSTLDNVLEELS